jgi:hypothetical protein
MQGYSRGTVRSHLPVRCASRCCGVQIGFAETKAKQDGWNDQWWWSAHAALVNTKIRPKKHRTRSDSVTSTATSECTSSDEEGGTHVPPTDEELFKACGGRRLGMRARADQRGKWQRVEGGRDGAPVTHDTLEQSERPDSAKEKKKKKEEKKKEKKKEKKRRKKASECDS